MDTHGGDSFFSNKGKTGCVTIEFGMLGKYGHGHGYHAKLSTWCLLRSEISSKPKHVFSAVIELSF